MDRIPSQFSNLWLIPIFLVFSGCQKAPVLEDFGPLPEFELTNELGKPFGTRQLVGKPWIADFIYSTCPGPCPRMSAIMARLQTEGVDYRMVSFTIDPAHDTPEILAAYAKRFKADTSRWTFLTGPRETLQMLNRKGFKLGDVDGSLDHSTRFVLVDRKMHIRGYYGTSDEEGVERLKHDLASLVKESR
jgi:protein SCO1